MISVGLENTRNPNSANVNNVFIEIAHCRCYIEQTGCSEFRTIPDEFLIQESALDKIPRDFPCGPRKIVKVAVDYHGLSRNISCVSTC